MTLAPAIGAVLGGRYRLERELGRGGAGTVWRARDHELERDVAIKLLNAELDDDARARLQHEARIAAGLNHPNIVAVHDIGDHHGVPYVVMELVEGRDLRSAGALELPALLELTRQLCEALSHAHARGIVHRDLKPENILLAPGRGAAIAKLADLGIARSTRGTRMTTDGALVGTAGYLAPEQALGGEVDGRADLYALGVVLYERLAGRPPFEGDPLAVISQHLHAPVTPPRTFRPDLPPALEAIVLKLLAKDPAQRFATAAELERALDAVPLDGAAATPESTSAPVLLLEQLVRGRLVGRAPELEQLRELWRLSARGRAHLALVSGEPGAGKTRLAHEAIVYAQLSGATVLRGGCYEYEATTPYLPFVEALQGWVRSKDAPALEAALGPLAPVLARLAPEIEAKLGPQPAPPTLAPHEERLRLFDHVAQLLQRMSTPAGVLLFIDDLHWADQGSLALLHYVLRQLRSVPLLVLATYREIELDRAHPLAAALVEWNRERLMTRIALARFDRAGTSALLATLMSQETVTQDFADAVHRETEGNPFFIEEVVKALIEQGQIYRDGGEWQRRDVQELTIPQSVKSAIGRRLDRLSPGCSEMLHVAAALGKSFGFDELAATQVQNEDALLDGLDEAVRAQLLQPQPGDRYVFTHDKIREVLYEELNPVRRRRLHQRIGEALEKVPGTKAAVLAHHFVASGDLTRGLHHSLAAAEAAGAVYAHGEAIAYLDHARECAEGLEDRTALARVEQRLGAVLGSVGEIERSVAHYERALALTDDADARVRLHLAIAERWMRIGNPAALDQLDAAEAALDPDRMPREHALALMVRARFEHYRGHHREAVGGFERALAVAEALKDEFLIGDLCGYLAGAHQHLAENPRSNAYARRAIALGEGGHRVLAGLGYEFLAENAYNAGRYTEGIEYAHQELAVVRQIHSRERYAWSQFTLACNLLGHGGLEAAREAFAEALRTCEHIGERRLGALLMAYSVMVDVELGRLDEAEAVLREGSNACEATGLLFLRLMARSTSASLAAARGDHAQVLARHTEIEAMLEGTDAEVVRIRTLPMAAEALRARGDAEGARALVENLLERARVSDSPGSEALAFVVRAAIHADAGATADARADLDAALERFERSGARLDFARGLLARSRLREHGGDAAGGAQDRARAEALFRACGATADLARLGDR